MSATSSSVLAKPFWSTYPDLETLIAYSPGCTWISAQPLADDSVLTAVGPVKAMFAPLTFSVGVVTWTTRRVPGGGLMRLVSTTGLVTPIECHVTVETVLISSASSPAGSLQLDVASLSLMYPAVVSIVYVVPFSVTLRSRFSSLSLLTGSLRSTSCSCCASESAWERLRSSVVERLSASRPVNVPTTMIPSSSALIRTSTSVSPRSPGRPESRVLCAGARAFGCSLTNTIQLPVRNAGALP